MTRLTTTCAIAITLSLTAACGSDDGDGGGAVSDEPLAGRVGGQDWAFVRGQTDAFLSDEQSYFAVLHAEDFETCGFSEPAGNHLILSIPTSPGDYDLSLSLNMTFVVYEDGDGGAPNNKVATRGRIIVDEITADTISGGIHGILDGDNDVDGRFAVSICAQ